VWCRRCGAPVEHPAEDFDGCAHCRRRRFKFSAVYALGIYEGKLRMAILRMKRYRANSLRMAVARLLADQLAPRIADEPLDVVLPVPMHWTRRLFNGINSPEVFATRLAGQLDLPVRCDLLRRRRSTQLQAPLSIPQRKANVRGAFSLTRGTDVRDARILLVDDVLTTGATCQEVARTLRAAGAKRVIAAVVGRTSGSEVKAH
jgi:ComF family protein